MQITLALYAVMAFAAGPVPSVYYIGDSISNIAVPWMRPPLDGVATVKHSEPLEGSPTGNALDSGYSLAHIHEWLPEGRNYDLILINSGLHDIERIDADRHLRVSPEQYRLNMRELIAHCQAHAGVVLVPLTTVVPTDNPYYFRHPEDVPVYNAILADEARRAGCQTVNLYGPTAAHLDWYPPGDVHPSDVGRAALGVILADAVVDALGVQNVPAVSGSWLLLLCVVIVVIALGTGIHHGIHGSRCQN